MYLIAIGLISGFFIGLVIGYLVAMHTKTVISFKILVGGGVFLIWMCAAAISLATQGKYEVPIAIHGIFGGIVTALWGDEQLSKLLKK